MQMSDVFRAVDPLHHAMLDAGLIHKGDTLVVERAYVKEGIPWSLYLYHGCEEMKALTLNEKRQRKVEGIDLHDCFTAEQAYFRMTSATHALDAVTRMNRQKVMEK